MAEQFAVLFSKAKKMFAGIFSWKKETSGMIPSLFIPSSQSLPLCWPNGLFKEEKAEGNLLWEEANLDSAELDRQLRIKKAKAKEERKNEEARKKREEEGKEWRRQNGGQ